MHCSVSSKAEVLLPISQTEDSPAACRLMDLHKTMKTWLAAEQVLLLCVCRIVVGLLPALPVDASLSSEAELGYHELANKPPSFAGNTQH